MTNDETKDFIKAHRDDDIRQLALQAARYPDVDMTYAVTQIAGWQKARQKLPSWTLLEGIVYPPHLSLEQCSSETTALYKKNLCCRLLQQYDDGLSSTLVDLTGGFGVDFAFMAKAFQRAVYIEQQQTLCHIAAHNFPLLGLPQAQVIQGDGMETLATMPACTVAYADPARRDQHGARTYAISDCTPDILTHLTMMLSKARFVILKLSPMLDIHKTIDDLQRQHPDVVKEVHIVATGNECKELLIVLSTLQMSSCIYCVNDHDTHTMSIDTWRDRSPLPIADNDHIQTAQYLYEPNAAIMKAGGFHTLTAQYQLRVLSTSSHLFLSTMPHDGFPGRRFQIISVSTLNKREIKEKLKGIAQANITVRNFPLSVADIRKRLKLREGGIHYIFATTTATGTHLLFVCIKA